MSTTIVLTAADTLFFGSGRPFTMQEDSWTLGVFPPAPETLFGFLRGNYFLSNMGDYEKVDKENDPTQNLEIVNFGLQLVTKDSTEKLYPLPMDLVKNISTEKPELMCLHPKENSIVSNDVQLPYKLTYKGKDKVRNYENGFYLNETNFQKYIKWQNRDINPVKLEEYVTGEPKIGIRRNRFNANDKALYRINLTSLETLDAQINIWITFDGININTHFSRMGGEGKLVTIDNFNNNDKIISETEFNKGDIVKMYLQSPAIFENGWLPDVKKEIELLAAVNGKPQFIGGFDAKKKQPKPTLRAVPAGSIYYFEIKEETILPLKIGMNTNKGYGNVIYIKQ